MTDRYYVGTQVDCNAVRAALNVAKGLPKPGTVNGVPIVNEPTRIAMTATWWNLTPAQREDPVNWAPWAGWTLQWSSLNQEPAPGVRFYVVVPDNLPTVISQAAAAGITLSLAETTALTAAAALSTAQLPANWVTEQFPE